MKLGYSGIRSLPVRQEFARASSAPHSAGSAWPHSHIIYQMSRLAMGRSVIQAPLSIDNILSGV